ncbi:CHAD domain-containing protein [Streptomyces albireticuli]|uniref:CHAD domain-containing protein n=2 Tax=Streptomyces albireticuli TaxID=1940 RepID=UPI001E41A199|nr:CHAD domain-containing protein [Streptomyces albireticuli]MCD9143046.1 CHAD domain-containing protein [Streptomyces albireticuli]MCD9165289.1 CHAD domain-containing protein [Streptomyces albireticuli]MCD9192193.1 CHAD domain-containing protein [Streptomyces albireticuli]
MKTGAKTGATGGSVSGSAGGSAAGAARGADRGAPSAAAEATAGAVLAGYLHAQAAEFLRSLRLHRESGADAEDASEAARMLRRSARRIAGTLHVYRPLTDVTWTDPLRSELLWLSETLGREYAHAARLARLRGALHRLSGAEGPVGQAGQGGQAGPTGLAGVSGARGSAAGGGSLTVGAARAGALLERQLTLARTRAHSAALQALGSSRFHAVADAAAVLASELPLDPAAHDLLAREALPCLAEQAHRRLTDAAEALPLAVAGHPYNAEALTHGLAAVPGPDAPPAEGRQDAPWHQVRRLVRLRRYAQEVLDEHVASEAEPTLSVRLLGAGQALDRHRDAAEAAAAAAAAARTPRIAPATAYALGVLHADQRHEVEAARYAFGRIWQRLALPSP